jgi:uncharacterized coiled-coil protein SlyX
VTLGGVASGVAQTEGLVDTFRIIKRDSDEGREMARRRIYCLPVAILLASTALAVDAATETERIAALEQQLNQQKLVMQQQQRLLESMATELQRLKDTATARARKRGDAGHEAAGENVGEHLWVRANRRYL